MVTIRLARGGAKKRPFYHIVVSDIRKPRDSGYIERIGYFNPSARGQEVRLHVESERAQYWVSNGAQPTDRVKSLLKDAEKQAANAPVETPATPAAEAETEAAA